MWRPAFLGLATMLSFLGGSAAAHAYDNRIDPNATRRSEFSLAFPKEASRALTMSAEDRFASEKTNLPLEYASAMTWYRVALSSGSQQPPMVASPWGYDEQLPETLNWAWVADDGNMITRTGKGVFRLSFADNRSNWFRETECRLQSWPDGTSQAPMLCDDGLQRTLQIPGDGIVLVDDVQFTRVFTSEETTLPPEEAVSVDEATAALLAGDPIPDHIGLRLPDTAPIPQMR